MDALVGARQHLVLGSTHKPPLHLGPQLRVPPLAPEVPGTSGATATAPLPPLHGREVPGTSVVGAPPSWAGSTRHLAPGTSGHLRSAGSTWHLLRGTFCGSTLRGRSDARCAR